VYINSPDTHHPYIQLGLMMELCKIELTNENLKPILLQQ
jgi:hypothetical protein